MEEARSVPIQETRPHGCGVACLSADRALFVPSQIKPHRELFDLVWSLITSHISFMPLRPGMKQQKENKVRGNLSSGLIHLHGLPP